MQVPSSSEGGDDRPTFFELVAADKLVPSLRAALVYSVGVLVSRRPSLARLLDHEDEAFALFMLLVEWHSFATSDGSLAEGLYGLQRTRARGSKLPRTEPASRPAPQSAARRMTKSQRIASVALLVGVPYARAKLDKLYERLARARGLEHATDADAVAGAILGADEFGGEARQSAGGRNRDGTGAARGSGRGGSDSSASEDASSAEESLATRRGLLDAFGRFTTATARGDRRGGVSGTRGDGDGDVVVADSRTRVSRFFFSRAAFVGCEDLFVRAYPLAHAAWEAATLAHWVRFLLGGGETHDPALALVGVRVARTSAREAMQRRVELETARAEAVASFSGPASSFAARALGPPLLRARHFAADYAQGGLMLCVVGFKLMEWWYGTAEEKVTGSLALPVPPPPPTPPPHKDGVKVAPSPGACPLCGASPAVSPAAPACSGYVCCHACLTAHIREHNACPVTLLPARLEDIRKLFSE